MSKSPAPPPTKRPAADRAEREAEALRENLRRRKEQARARPPAGKSAEQGPAGKE